MNILLNFVAFILCIFWFHKRMDSNSSRLVLPVIFVYLFTSILIVVLSLFIQNQYLDGINYVTTGGIALLLFWAWTSIVIVVKNNAKGTHENILIGLAQNILLLIAPMFLWFIISNASLKIGG